MKPPLRVFNGFQPEELILQPGERAPMAPEWQALHDRLAWLYGLEQTADIFAGRNAATTADLASWRALGRS